MYSYFTTEKQANAVRAVLISVNYEKIIVKITGRS